MMIYKNNDLLQITHKTTNVLKDFKIRITNQKVYFNEIFILLSQISSLK